MKLDDINILDVGTKIQIAGAIWADGETIYLMPLPGALTDEQKTALPVFQGGTEHPVNVERLDMNLADWQRFVRQTDLLETEVLAAHDPDETGKIPKILLRKSARQISRGVSWSVYKRDGYRCRYCGKDGIPMTVDHIVLWEHGGPSIEENLVAACRKCNKKRGNMPYDEWLRSPYYRMASRNLIIAAAEANEDLVATLDSIPRMIHKPSKR